MRSVANKFTTSSRIWFLLALCVVAGVGCAQRSPTRYDSEFLAMGTQVQLALLANSPREAAQLSAAIQQLLLRQGIDWYAFTPDDSGELKQLNAALAAGHRQTLSPASIELLRRAQALQQLSDGYFDPAIEPMTEAWGFADLTGKQPALPDAGVLQRWKGGHATLAALRIEGNQVSSGRRDLQLDLGAIAKGYAQQLALQSLQQRGCHEAALNLGGQLAVMGKVMPQQLGAVAIRDPRAARALAELHLAAGESISTSGDYERYAQVNARRIHHILDPRTGEPVSHTQAVTVISHDATLADAASTALMVAGPADWQRIARALGVSEVLRIDATGAIEVTTALYARLKWRADIASTRIKQIQL